MAFRIIFSEFISLHRRGEEEPHYHIWQNNPPVTLPDDIISLLNRFSRNTSRSFYLILDSELGIDNVTDGEYVFYNPSYKERFSVNRDTALAIAKNDEVQQFTSIEEIRKFVEYLLPQNTTTC